MELRLSYRGTYRDAIGVEPIEVVHDASRSMRVAIRGLAFEGTDFDALDPVAGEEAARAAGFTTQVGSVCACELACALPVTVVLPDGTCEHASLAMRLVLGAPSPRGQLDREDLALELALSIGTFRSPGTSGWFEDEMLELQRTLPPGCYVRACVHCGLSDYSPYGHGLFGGLMCFRDNADAYRAVRSKAELFGVMDTMTGLVPETYVCPAFERRVPGTGYRG